MEILNSFESVKKYGEREADCAHFHEDLQISESINDSSSPIGADKNSKLRIVFERRQKKRMESWGCG